MKNMVFRRIFRPVVTRIGTALSAFFIGTIHADPALVDQFTTALTSVLLIGFDVVAARWFHNSERV